MHKKGIGGTPRLGGVVVLRPGTMGARFSKLGKDSCCGARY